jgi:hypothetical protein
MHDTFISPESAGWFSALLAALSKFCPPALGALLMILVDMPKTRREYFFRFASAFIVSILFGEALFDFLDSTSWFAFLDSAKRSHQSAVDGLAGAFGYFLVGGAAQFLHRFRANPTAAIAELKEVAKP